LKEYLSKNDIDFTEYNVAENKEAAMEMVEKTKQMGVPVTIIDDTDIIVGYDPLKLDELLKTNS
jgi:glutaredoxin 3